MTDLLTAYIGLGSSEGDRLGYLRAATHALGERCEVLRCSSVFETRPLGSSPTPYFNAAVEVRTALSPQGLLDVLRAVEDDHHRARDDHWASRTLDLDALLGYREGKVVEIASEDLTLPHPELTRRDFVLVPLCELAPELVVAGRTLADHLAGISAAEKTVLRRLSQGLERAPGLS